VRDFFDPSTVLGNESGAAAVELLVAAPFFGADSFRSPRPASSSLLPASSTKQAEAGTGQGVCAFIAVR